MTKGKKESSEKRKRKRWLRVRNLCYFFFLSSFSSSNELWFENDNHCEPPRWQIFRARQSWQRKRKEWLVAGKKSISYLIYISYRNLRYLRWILNSKNDTKALWQIGNYFLVAVIDGGRGRFFESTENESYWISLEVTQVTKKIN